jgi:glutathione synthase/RimK-type ligase-like ATP-grasp enzyme
VALEVAAEGALIGGVEPLPNGSRQDVGGEACSNSSSIGSKGGACLHQAALEGIAGYLREQLGLTLLGFDVVLAEGSGEYLVIDVNYFPNFKGGKDTASYFRGAMRDALETHRRGVCARVIDPQGMAHNLD